MAALLPMLLFFVTLQFCNNSICDVTMGHTLGALSNQKAALLVLPSSNNPHDINVIKLEYLMDEIIVFTN